MTEPTSALQYTQRGSEAIQRVLIELAHILGAYLDRLVVIGGMVPTLLLDTPEMPHIGTLDIDLALDAAGLRENDEYARLIELLEAHSYVRRGGETDLDLKPFQLQRNVDLQDGGPVVQVVIDLLMPKGVPLTKHRPPLVDALRVQEIDGGQLALDHHVQHVLKGYTPEGWRDVARLRVVSVPAFLALKGNALQRRRKQKDAYDIYYVIRNFPEGLDALVEACRPLLVDPLAQAAYLEIATKFGSADAYGPGTVSTFLRGRLPVGFTEERLRTDAYRQVSAWARSLGVSKN